jgi:hypothetical protein
MILTTIFKQGDMQDQPLLSLTPENYPSLEFLEEAPARGSARRLEFAHEHRNGGGARRLYRPMMCAADVLRFLGTEFAQRAGGAAGAGLAEKREAPPDEKKEKRLGRANPEHEHHAPGEPPHSAPPGEPPHSAPPAAGARLSDLERRVRAHAAADALADAAAGAAPGSAASAASAASARKRRRLAHEARFLHRSALVDAYASLLEELRAGD